MHRLTKDNRCRGRHSNRPLRNITEQCYLLSHLVQSREIIIESHNMTIPTEGTVMIRVLGRPYYMRNRNGIFHKKTCHIRNMQQGHYIRGWIGTRVNLEGWPEKNPGTELLSYSSASGCTDRFKSLGRFAITECVTAIPVQQTRVSWLSNVGT